MACMHACSIIIRTWIISGFAHAQIKSYCTLIKLAQIPQIKEHGAHAVRISTDRL